MLVAHFQSPRREAKGEPQQLQLNLPVPGTLELMFCGSSFVSQRT